jgi:hypothetical protein
LYLSAPLNYCSVMGPQYRRNLLYFTHSLSSASCDLVFTFLDSNTTLQTRIYKMEAAKPARIYSSPSSSLHFFENRW